MTTNDQIARMPAGSPDGGKFATRPGGAEAATRLDVADESRPQDRVPEWNDERFSPCPSPITLGTVIDAKDAIGRIRRLVLDRYESDPGDLRSHQRPVWEDLYTHEEFEPNDIKEWRPVSYTGVEGDLEEAYRAAQHHLYEGHADAERVENAIVDKIGIEDQKMTAAVSGGGHPMAAFFGANADGSKGYKYHVHRDLNTGLPTVATRPGQESQRIRKMNEFLTSDNNLENILAWRERRAHLSEVADEARGILHEHHKLTGSWM